MRKVRQLIKFAVVIPTFLILTLFIPHKNPAFANDCSSPGQQLMCKANNESPANTYNLQVRKELPEFNIKYGGKWYVEEDERTHIPKKIEGGRIAINTINFRETTITKENALDISSIFLRANKDILKINPETLVKNVIWEDTISYGGTRFVTVHLTQEHNKIPVDGARVSLLYANNNLVSYNSSYQPDIMISHIPNINENQALDTAKTFETLNEKGLTKDKTLLEMRDAKLVILSPLSGKDINDYKLAWKLEIVHTPVSGKPSQVTYYIDADTKQELKRDEHIYKVNPINGEVFSYIYRTGPRRETNQTKAGFNDLLVEAFYNSTFVDLSYTQNHCDTGCQDPTVCCRDGYFYIDQLTQNAPHDLRITFYDPNSSVPHIRIEGTDNEGHTVPSWFQGALWLSGFDPGSFNNIDLSRQGFDETRNNEASNLYYHLKKAWEFFDRASPFDNFPAKLNVTATINSADACNAVNNIQYLQPSGEWLIDLGFAEGGSGSAGYCSATSLDSDIIFHEFSHLVTEYTYGFGFLQNVYMQGTMKEAFSDYWAASINNQPQITEGSATTGSCNRPPGTCPVRNLNNNLWYPYNYVDSFENERYYSSQILSGAMWEYRSWIVNVYASDLGGVQNAIDLADAMMMITMKDTPLTFEQFLGALIVRDRAVFTGAGKNPNTYPICQFFCADHGICNSECTGLGITPPTTPLPPGQGQYKVPVDGSFVDNTSTEISSIGVATPGNYLVDKRTFQGGDWNTAGITIDGTELSDGNIRLATTKKDKLIDGCFYEGRLSSGQSQEIVTFKKISGTHDQMPRMACVRRTGGQGAENDACDIIALMSDPKPAYYQMAATDWRKGRDAILPGDNNRQFSYVDKRLCDPAGVGMSECAKDCWNIIGELGNRNSSNDGIDDVFCKAGAGCSPVSFSGCSSDGIGGPNCVADAITNLDAVYHKVLYYHWVDKDSMPNGCDHDSCFLCARGQRFGYGLLVFTDRPGYIFDNFRNQCSSPRCEINTVEDDLDGFYRLKDYGFGLNKSDFHQYGLPRSSDTPITNCELCECSTASPYCNRTGDVCEASCTESGGNCLTHVTSLNLIHDAYMSGSPNYTVTDTANNLLIDDNHVAFIRFLGDVSERKKVSLNLYNIGGSAEVVIRYLNYDYGSWQNHNWLRPIDYDSNSLSGAIVAIISLQPGWNSIDITDSVNPIYYQNRGYIHPFSIRKWSGTGSVSIASSESANSPYLDMWAVPKCKGGIAFGACSGNNYCDKGNVEIRCNPVCPGASCPSGSVCSSLASGLCVKCNTNADCEDGSFCTTGTCNNPGREDAYCTQTVTAPNDCPASWECGQSPNGCYSCGSCPRNYTCLMHSCVLSPCNPKNKDCKDVRYLPQAN